MQSSTAAESKATLEVYPIDGYVDADGSSKELLNTLQAAVPEARVSINADKKMVVAWAKPEEQKTIKTILEKLDVEQSPSEMRQLEVHRLTKVDPETTLALFQTILPDARLAVDTQTRSLIAVAKPSDQEVIRTTHQSPRIRPLSLQQRTSSPQVLCMNCLYLPVLPSSDL